MNRSPQAWMTLTLPPAFGPERAKNVFQRSAFVLNSRHMGALKLSQDQPQVSLATTTVEVVYVKHGVDISYPAGTRILIDVKTGLALFDNEDHTELDPDEYTFHESN